MPPEKTSNFIPMRQEADMPSAFDSLESGAWNGLSKQPLAHWRNDGILGPRENQCRNIDFPEAVADVECFELCQSLGHDALIGLPDPIDDEVSQGAGFGLHAVQQVEKLVEKRIVRGEGKPLQHAASNR